MKYSATSFSHYNSLLSKDALPEIIQDGFWGKLVRAFLTWVAAHKTMYQYQDLVDKREQATKLKRIQHVLEELETKN